MMSNYFLFVKIDTQSTRINLKVTPNSRTHFLSNKRLWFVWQAKRLLPGSVGLFHCTPSCIACCNLCWWCKVTLLVYHYYDWNFRLGGLIPSQTIFIGLHIDVCLSNPCVHFHIFHEFSVWCSAVEGLLMLESDDDDDDVMCGQDDRWWVVWIPR